MNDFPATPADSNDPHQTPAEQAPTPPRRVRRASAKSRRRLRAGIITGAAGLAVIATVGVGGAAFAANQSAASALGSSSASGSSTIVDNWGALHSRAGGYSSGSGTATSPYGSGSGSGFGSGSGSAGSASSTATDAVPATTDQAAGVVTVLTQLGFQNSEAAGTGIVLDSNGLILTNNHVVEGSTRIQVTDETTGQAYTASVVGTDATDDIALLQLQGASGLTTASLDTGMPATTGETVTAVGNAGGTGDLVAASGTVTATNQTITTQSEASVSGETLNGLIQVDADIVAGDSGGPLVDAQGEVVGIDTAASSGSAQVAGFAIPIQIALGIAAEIEQGTETATIEIGYPGFLGVEVASNASIESNAAGTIGSNGRVVQPAAGALIAGVVTGTPAADAGIAAGDTVTSVNGTAVTSAEQLSSVLGSMEPGQSVALAWTTASGTAGSATVTLIDGPAA
jgi:S1-C subfamily serine protease